MIQGKKKTVVLGGICIFVLILFCVFFFYRPGRIERTMSGVVIDKKTHKVVEKTSATINLNHYKGSNHYNYKGNIEFKDLGYTKEKKVNILLSDGSNLSKDQLQKFDTNGAFTYESSKKAEDEYVPYTYIMNVTVADSELSKFVITSYDDPDRNEANNDVIMVFPAENEQEAFDVINQFKTKERFFE